MSRLSLLHYIFIALSKYLFPHSLLYGCWINARYSSNWIHIRVASLVYREERAILCGSPLSLLITAIFSALVWSEQLSWGSILGGIMVVGGLYSVMWGRSKEYSQLMLKSEPPTEKGQDIERD
ncbi:wat1-related protein [Quercus suber]|uniref:Wat1-related protein n=1 Tax=Quercus suber TaxID=58331 RepID=A0AAW0K5X6_QUESU